MTYPTFSSGTIYAFLASSPAHGYGWWTFNSATGAVKDTYIDGAPTFSIFPPPSVAVGNLVLFAGGDATHGDELWALESDTGSHLVANIAPGVRSSHPDHLTAAGNVAYFTATTLNAGNELWRTDGTATGTWQVTDLVAGANSTTPSHLQPYKQGLFFWDRGARGCLVL